MSDLNKRAALAMGWVERLDMWVDIIIPEEFPGGGYVKKFKVDDFDPMTRWDHAGMLVEKLSEKNIYIELNQYENNFCVTLRKNYFLVAQKHGVTAPEAITRAFIKAMEAK